MYLSAPLVTQHGGLDVANNIKHAGMGFLGITGKDWKSSFTAMAFDGAYFKIYVHTHLNSITGGLSPVFRIAVWCGAHRLELVFLDIYKCRPSKFGVDLPQAKWVTSLDESLNAQIDPHRRDKGYEEIREFALEIGEELREQLRFSTTRWAASLRQVIKNWIYNKLEADSRNEEQVTRTRNDKVERQGIPSGEQGGATGNDRLEVFVAGPHAGGHHGCCWRCPCSSRQRMYWPGSSRSA